MIACTILLILILTLKIKTAMICSCDFGVVTVRNINLLVSFFIEV